MYQVPTPTNKTNAPSSRILNNNFIIPAKIAFKIDNQLRMTPQHPIIL